MSIKGGNAGHECSLKFSGIDSYMLTFFLFLDTKVYSALGNHDYHPKSQLPAAPNYIYDQIANMWQSWLNPESRETFRKGGWSLQ